MIIVQLSGGFGNQLFQYASGLSLAEHHNVCLKVDVSLLEKEDVITGTFREMDIFKLRNIPIKATNDEINKFLSLSPFTSFTDKSKPFYKRKVYKEKSNMFDKNFFKAGKDLLLKGNRQSEKYFISIKETIVEKFSISEKVTEPVIEIGNTISVQNSVSIHIRRGDYLAPVALEWLGVQPISYYLKAIDKITKGIPNVKFYIFSDDITWVKQNLKLDHDHEFVSGNITTNALQDFYLMSKCKNNIIANSTFSWWAAWLNQNEGKFIIAPKKWYNQVTFDTTDLIPNSWIRI